MNKFRQALEELHDEYKFLPAETNEGFVYRALKMVSLIDSSALYHHVLSYYSP